MQSQLTNVTTKAARTIEMKKLISSEEKQVEKGKDPAKLIALLENMMIDSKLSAFTLEEISVLKRAYLFAATYAPLLRLYQRYQLEKDNIYHLAHAAYHENIADYVLHSKTYRNLLPQPSAHLLTKRMISFVLRVYSKYYLNYEVDELCKLLECQPEAIEDEGYQIKSGFVQLPQYEETDNDTNTLLQKKMRELIFVANGMINLE